MGLNNNFNYTKDDVLIDVSPNIETSVDTNFDKLIDDLVDINISDLLSLLDDTIKLKEVNDKVFNSFVDKYGKTKAKAIYYATANKQGRDPKTWEFTKKTNEENTSANVGGYNTPKAFIDGTEDELENKFDYSKYYGEKAPKIDPKLKGNNKYKKLKTESIETNNNSLDLLIDNVYDSFFTFDTLIKEALKFKTNNDVAKEQINNEQQIKLHNLSVNLIKVNMLLNNLSA